MQFKRTLIAAMMLGSFAGLAHADDDTNSVTLYGVLDDAVGMIEHSATANPAFPGSVNPVNKVSTSFPNHVIGMFSGGESMSRWGMRGNENLGGGWNAIFDLESAINLPSGQLVNAAGSLASAKTSMAAASAINGQLFARGAYVGLRNDQYGTLTFGRQTDLSFDVVNAYDPMGAAQLFSPIGFSGSYSAGGITEGSRQDNDIKYKAQYGAFNFGLAYSFGNQTSFGAGSSFNAAAGYEDHGFGVEATYFQDRDALHSGGLTGSGGSCTVNGATIGNCVGNVSAYNDHGEMLVGKYTYGPATLKAGYERYDTKALANAGGYVQDQYYGFNYVLTKGSGTTNNLFFIGGDYKLTPALDIMAGAYDTQTIDTAGNTGAKGTGNQLQFSLLADYSLSRRTDVYAGYMFSRYNGGEFTGDERNNYIVATGMRLKF